MNTFSSFFISFLLASPAFAATTATWNNTTTDGLWSTAANWSNSTLPTSNHEVKITKAVGPTITSSTAAQAFNIRLGASVNPLMTVSAGSLTTREWLMVGIDSSGQHGTLVINGGTLNIGIAGGVNGHFWVGFSAQGTVTINSGTVNVTNKFGIGFNASGDGKVYLKGGQVTCSDFSMSENGGAAKLDISGSGTLVIAGNKTSVISNYISRGLITANADTGTVTVDYDTINPGKTTVIAFYDPKLASRPAPADMTMGVDPNAILSFKPGQSALAHEIYLGTDPAAVSAASRKKTDYDNSGIVDYNDLSTLSDLWLTNSLDYFPYLPKTSDTLVNNNDLSLFASDFGTASSPQAMGLHDVNSLEPGTLSYDTTYYWRVDEVNADNTAKGPVWSFTTVSNDSLYGKIMCGYQGWFACPTDGSSRNWTHWGSNGFTPTNCTVDMWPDMSEMDASEKFAATAFASGSNQYYVFSSYTRRTVLRHFQWMQDYGIDGVFLQRFATETETIPAFLNTVLRNVREGANMYGRKYAIMYDLSGLPEGGTSKVMADWERLETGLSITKDPCDRAYIYHKGKPVIGIWGIGFHDTRYYTTAECETLVQYFKDKGFTVVLGVNDDWRSNSSLSTILLKSDIIMPWNVGRYGSTNPNELVNWVNSKWVGDLNWCNSNGKDYYPVVFPGFSWANLKKDLAQFNKIPRQGGQFLWSQYYQAKRIGCTMIYQAMFDEVDEGTAIFKIDNNPPQPGTTPMFLTLEGLPSDEYLWLCGQGVKLLKGQIPLNATRPARQ